MRKKTKIRDSEVILEHLFCLCQGGPLVTSAKRLFLSYSNFPLLLLFPGCIIRIKYISQAIY
jgi:hypothetical protein